MASTVFKTMLMGTIRWNTADPLDLGLVTRIYVDVFDEPFKLSGNQGPAAERQAVNVKVPTPIDVDVDWGLIRDRKTICMETSRLLFFAIRLPKHASRFRSRDRLACRCVK